jgi:hypothetical protein
MEARVPTGPPTPSRSAAQSLAALASSARVEVRGRVGWDSRIARSMALRDLAIRRATSGAPISRSTGTTSVDHRSTRLP